eukprot:8033907-Alexandrium_andersonii.AAC.1
MPRARARALSALRAGGGVRRVCRPSACPRRGTAALDAHGCPERARAPRVDRARKRPKSGRAPR